MEEGATSDRQPSSTRDHEEQQQQQQQDEEEEDEDVALSNSEYLTHQEVLKRRTRRLSRLSKCYRDYYWSLMEEVKRKHREYYWKYGKSPFKDEEGRENGGKNGDGDANLGLGYGNGNKCGFHGCRSKAMALSTHCHPHILSDPKQKLYKPCKFCFKSTGAGPILCGKPILVSTIPSLCPVHLQRAEKNLRGILKKEGAPVALSNRLASKFHLVITEYVHLIQTKRRAAAATTAVSLNNTTENIGAND